MTLGPAYVAPTDPSTYSGTWKFGHPSSFSSFSFINNWLFASEVSVKYIKFPTNKVIFDKWIEVHRIYRKCAIITWTQLGRCISMGTPIHSHYKKMNGKHRGRRIWKARGTAQLLRSTQNFCLLHHISLFYTFSVIFVQKVKYWLSYTPVQKRPANLVQQMNGFLWSCTCGSAGCFWTAV